MSVILNQNKSNTILRDIISEVKESHEKPKSKMSESIAKVILGTHLTYRYILTTGLLAKTTMNSCNPLTLQAGSSFEGAYDARSLCHNVLVPIERELLDNKLGASNEPFLNKPARYTELSRNNPVRRGNDTTLLNTTIEILESINTSNEAREYLKDCIYYILQRPAKSLSPEMLTTNINKRHYILLQFAKNLISQSHEGESCELLVGITYSILAISQSKSLTIKAHKTNQAGSSSKEVSDIDVYDNDKLIYTIEVKDKLFSASDVNHAVRKAKSAGCKSLIFALGPRGSLLDGSLEDLQDFWGIKGIDLYFVNVLDHFISILSTVPEIEISQFVKLINDQIGKSNVKDLTFQHILSCADLFGQI